MLAAGENVWKLTHQICKTNKSSPLQANFFEIWYFSNPGECISFMIIQPPLDKLGGLTCKGAPLISKFSKPTPLRLKPQKYRPPFQRRGGPSYVHCPLMAICPLLIKCRLVIILIFYHTFFDLTKIFNQRFYSFCSFYHMFLSFCLFLSNVYYW